MESRAAARPADDRWRAQPLGTAGWIEDYPHSRDGLSTNLARASPYDVVHAYDRTADALMRKADANPDAPSPVQAYQPARQIPVTPVAWIPLDQQTVWWETVTTLQGFTTSSTSRIHRASRQTMYASGR